MTLIFAAPKRHYIGKVYRALCAGKKDKRKQRDPCPRMYKKFYTTRLNDFTHRGDILVVNQRDVINIRMRRLKLRRARFVRILRGYDNACTSGSSFTRCKSCDTYFTPFLILCHVETYYPVLFFFLYTDCQAPLGRKSDNRMCVNNIHACVCRAVTQAEVFNRKDWTSG